MKCGEAQIQLADPGKPMNYLTHGYRQLDAPYRVAGTAIPDLLSAMDRRVRLRGSDWEVAVENPAERDLRDGALLHLRDDDWFHGTEAFESAVVRVTVSIRAAHPERVTLRARFLAHCMIEMLLDAYLMAKSPGIAERYYEALREVDSTRVERFVSRVARAPLPLGLWMERFREERFILDYADDVGLERRLAQVVRRVGLPPLPREFERLVSSARSVVFESAEDLLTP